MNLDLLDLYFNLYIVAKKMTQRFDAYDGSTYELLCEQIHKVGDQLSNEQMRKFQSMLLEYSKLELLHDDN